MVGIVEASVVSGTMDDVAGHNLPDLARGRILEIDPVAALELAWGDINPANGQEFVEEIGALVVEAAPSAETLEAFLDAAWGCQYSTRGGTRRGPTYSTKGRCLQ